MTCSVPVRAERFKRLHPEVAVHLQVENTRRCCGAVARGEADLALVGGVMPPDLEHLLQARCPLNLNLTQTLAEFRIMPPNLEHQLQARAAPAVRQRHEQVIVQTLSGFQGCSCQALPWTVMQSTLLSTPGTLVLIPIYPCRHSTRQASCCSAGGPAHKQCRGVAIKVPEPVGCVGRRRRTGRTRWWSLCRPGTSWRERVQ